MGVETAKEERERRGREEVGYQGVSTAWHVETWSDLPLPYQPMSSKLSKSSVIFGMAVVMIVLSNATRKTDMHNAILFPRSDVAFTNSSVVPTIS